MKKLGRIVSVTDGKLVLKSKELVRIGAEVYDSSERHVGTVVDYFGNTLGPYVIVSPKKDAGMLVGEEIYG
jgi:rRNA processing protein Gar1